MATISTTRAAYQHHANITNKRSPVANASQIASIDKAIKELEGMKNATTVAAFSLRYRYLREHLKYLFL